MDTHKTSHTHTHTSYSKLEIPIFTRLCEFYKNTSQHLSLFPKSKRYSLGQKIDQCILEIIELVITAGYLSQEQKLPYLKKASIKLELLKILLRLSSYTKCIENIAPNPRTKQKAALNYLLSPWLSKLRLPLNFIREQSNNEHLN